MAVDAFRTDAENHFSEKDVERLPRTALLRNTASARLGAHFQSSALQSPARKGRRTEYRAQCHQDDITGRRGAARHGLSAIKVSLRRGEKMSRKGYRLRTGVNTVVWRGSCLGPPKALRRKGAPPTYSRLPVYRKWQSVFSPAPARVGDVIDGAGCEQSEFIWLALNRQQYAGRWVALDGDELLAVGDSAQDVFAAIANRRQTPLVTRVEPDDELNFAGW